MENTATIETKNPDEEIEDKVEKAKEKLADIKQEPQPEKEQVPEPNKKKKKPKTKAGEAGKVSKGIAMCSAVTHVRGAVQANDISEAQAESCLKGEALKLEHFLEKGVITMEQLKEFGKLWLRLLDKTEGHFPEGEAIYQVVGDKYGTTAENSCPWSALSIAWLSQHTQTTERLPLRAFLRMNNVFPLVARGVKKWVATPESVKAFKKLVEK